MTPRSSSSVAFFLGYLFISIGAGGCSKGTPEVKPPPPAQESPGEQLFMQAKLFATRGESVRAEQYFLAAVREGVPRHEVFPLLLQSCVESGRLRSALSHVEEELRLRVDEPALLQLGASLSWALDQPRVAFRFVDRLEQAAFKRLPTLLFLAEFYDKRAGEPTRSMSHYREALSLTHGGLEAGWIQANLLRLQRELDERRVSIAARGTHNE